MWSLETIRRMNAAEERKAQRRRERRQAASSRAVEGADELLGLVPVVGNILDAAATDQGDQVGSDSDQDSDQDSDE